MAQLAYSMSSNNDSNDLAEGLRKWLEAGNLNDAAAIPETVDIGSMKRKAAQRIMAAQRATKYTPSEDEDRGQ